MLVVLAGAAVFLLVGCLVSDIFAQQTVAGLAQGAIFGSLALALVLIYRATEVINFAQGEMAMATTYVALPAHALGRLVLARVLPHAGVRASCSASSRTVVFIRPVQHRP